MSVLAVAGVARPAAHAAATGAPADQLGGSLLTPFASSMASEVEALLAAVRVSNGTVEMLHDAHGIDGRIGAAWIASDII